MEKYPAEEFPKENLEGRIVSVEELIPDIKYIQPPTSRICGKPKRRANNSVYYDCEKRKHFLVWTQGESDSRLSNANAA
jgi:hypothetical protein